jgi:HEPN domain-containing protein
MTTEEKVTYWVGLSDYDLETAEGMMQIKKYLYVAFMCHQAIEKIFKAAYAQHKENTPPFVHKLSYIAGEGGFLENFSEEQIEFIDQLEPLNIKTRYPDYKKELAKRLTPTICQEIINETKKLQQWTKENLLFKK